MNKEYCYMRDMYCKYEVEDINNVTFVNDVNYKRRRVNGIKYRDPDYNCNRLYDDMNKIFFEGKLIKCFDLYDQGQLVLIQDDIRLTTDYIGPSLTSLKRAGVSDEEAWKTVLKCRTIGGHLIWPRVAHGINPGKAASGNRGNGISDRIDIALYEIKCYLDKIESKKYNKTLINSFSKEQNQKWFGNLKFSDFCDFYCLKGSFVDENYEINWLADPELNTLNKEIMRSYSLNNIKAIEKRNDAICKQKGNICD